MCILTMKSMTQALRARGALAARGILSEVVNIDAKLTAKGCAYGVELPCPLLKKALSVLAEKSISFGVVLGAGEPV